MCVTDLDTSLVETNWDNLVHERSGDSRHASAVAAPGQVRLGRTGDLMYGPACNSAACCARPSWPTASSTPASPTSPGRVRNPRRGGQCAQAGDLHRACRARAGSARRRDAGGGPTTLSLPGPISAMAVEPPPGRPCCSAGPTDARRAAGSHRAGRHRRDCRHQPERWFPLPPLERYAQQILPGQKRRWKTSAVDTDYRLGLSDRLEDQQKLVARQARRRPESKTRAMLALRARLNRHSSHPEIKEPVGDRRG